MKSRARGLCASCSPLAGRNGTPNCPGTSLPDDGRGPRAGVSHACSASRPLASALLMEGTWRSRVPALFILMIVMGGYCAFYYGDAHLHALVKGGLAVAAVVAAVRWVASRAIEHVRVGRHRRRIERLQAFSNQ